MKTANQIDRLTQLWVKLTGRTVDLDQDSWLNGPIGEPSGVGKDYFHKLAEKLSLRVCKPSIAGLLTDFSILQSPSCNIALVSRRVVDFYQETSAYQLDAWSEWMGVFRPFGFLLARIFSRRLQQLNVPLSSLDTSRGITSEILQLIDPVTREVRVTAWMRELLATGNVLYAGAYSTCRIPKCQGVCIKVAFPLPNGNAMVIMRPGVHVDGSFSVISSGEGFGDAGFYFTVHSGRRVRARYLKSLRETIRVYAAEGDRVRADHILSLWGITFLRLHYLLERRTADVAEQSEMDASANLN